MISGQDQKKVLPRRRRGRTPFFPSRLPAQPTAGRLPRPALPSSLRLRVRFPGCGPRFAPKSLLSGIYFRARVTFCLQNVHTRRFLADARAVATQFSLRVNSPPRPAHMPAEPVPRLPPNAAPPRYILRAPRGQCLMCAYLRSMLPPACLARRLLSLAAPCPGRVMLLTHRCPAPV